MEDTVIEEDQNTNPQLTENFFIKLEYVFVINSMNKKKDKFVSIAFQRYQSL